MQLSEYTSFDATALAGLIAEGSTTVTELLDVAQEACLAVNPEINAVVEVYDDPRVPEPVDTDAMFAGVPFLMKDFGAHEHGRRQWMGSRAVGDELTGTESALARRFRETGLISIGRTATCEFAITATVETARFGATRNPWDPRRTAGGSSGGAAAAVAAGVVPMAHATDSGGSIRIPAACCGLVGLKPSRGRISSAPAGPAPGDFHTEFVLTRSVRDATHALAVLEGTEPGDPYAVPPLDFPVPPASRIAVATHAPWLPAPDAAAVETTVRTARQCEQFGYTVDEATPTIDWQSLFEAMKDLWALGTLDTVRGWADVSSTERPADVEGLTWDLVGRARRLQPIDVLDALAEVDRATRAFAAFMADYDMLLTPALPGPPPLLGDYSPDMDLDEYYDSPVGRMESAAAVFNATGQPAITVPVTLADGLPMSVQIAGRAYEETALLTLAAELEAELDWARWRPPVHAARTASGDLS